MKRVTLFRHAKSSWKFAVSDVFRPLNARGLAQGETSANSCVLPPPDAVFSSHAARALSTAVFYIEAKKVCAEQLRVCPEIYEASSLTLLTWLKGLDNCYQDIWVFGHNPGFNDLIALLSGKNIDNLVTSGYVRLECDTGRWESVKANCAEITVINQRNTD